MSAPARAMDILLWAVRIIKRHGMGATCEVPKASLEARLALLYVAYILLP